MSLITDTVNGWGSQTVSIPITAGVTFVAENIDINEPQQTVNQYNQVGAPNGFISQDDFVTGSMTLQLPAGLSDFPERGDDVAMAIG